MLSRTVAVTTALTAALLVSGGCSAQKTTALQKPTTVWHVGAYTVRQLTVPASVITEPYAVQVGATTIIQVSTSMPYAISRRPLENKRWTTVAHIDCAQQPTWTYIQGPLAALLCPGPIGGTGSENRLVLITAGGSVSTYTLPVRLGNPVGRGVNIWGLEFDGGAGGLLWTADYDTEPPVQYGSGLLTLSDGKDTAIPPSLSVPSVSPCVGPYGLSPDDALYWTDSNGVYRWDGRHRIWTFLGQLPSFIGNHPSSGTDGCVMATADDGSVWVAMSATENDFTRWLFQRAAPGSRHVEDWRVHGDIVGIGPGYAIYVPAMDQTSLAIYFPLQDRTLHFTGLNPPPSDPVSGIAYMGEMYFHPATQVVLTGKGTNAVEIEISQ